MMLLPYTGRANRHVSRSATVLQCRICLLPWCDILLDSLYSRASSDVRPWVRLDASVATRVLSCWLQSKPCY